MTPRYKKKNPTKAEQVLRAEWAAILKASAGGLARKVTIKFKPPVASSSLRLEFSKPRGEAANLYKFKSRGDQSGQTPFRSSPVYSGDKMLGIATHHKSNSVPTFSKDEILDICKMRRG